MAGITIRTDGPSEKRFVTLSIFLFLSLYSLRVLALPASPGDPSCGDEKGPLTIVGSTVPNFTAPSPVDSVSRYDEILSFMTAAGIQFNESPAAKLMERLSPKSAGKLLDRMNRLSRSDAQQLVTALAARSIDHPSAPLSEHEDSVTSLLRRFQRMPSQQLRLLGKDPLGDALVSSMIDEALTEMLVDFSRYYPKYKDSIERTRAIDAAKDGWRTESKKLDPDILGAVLAAAKTWPQIYRTKLFARTLFYITAKGVVAPFVGGTGPDSSTLKELENHLTEMSTIPKPVQVFTDLVARKTPDSSPEALAAALSFLSRPSYHRKFYPDPVIGGSQNLDSKALKILGASDSSNPEINGTLKRLEVVHDSILSDDAGMALLARGVSPGSYKPILKGLDREHRLNLRRFVEIHKRGNLAKTLNTGTIEVIDKLRTVTANGGFSDLDLAQLLLGTAYGWKPATGDVLSFIEDYQIGGSEINKALLILSSSTSDPSSAQRALQLLNAQNQ